MENYDISLKTTRRSELADITRQVKEAVQSSGIQYGVCTVYSPHTTAGITINEAADPAVRTDMEKELDKIVPWKDGYAHAEGNSAAHIKASLTGPSVTIPIRHSNLTLGTWQGIYFAEWDGPRSRKVLVQILGT